MPWPRRAGSRQRPNRWRGRYKPHCEHLNMGAMDSLHLLIPLTLTHSPVTHPHHSPTLSTHRSCTHSLTHATHSLTYSLDHALAALAALPPSATPSLTLSTHSLPQSLHSLTLLSLTQTPLHSLSHSLASLTRSTFPVPIGG